MTRAVLSIDPLGAFGANGTELTIVKVVRAPWIVPDQGKAHALQLAAATLPAWHQPHAVRLRGQCVRDALVKHPGVARMLDLLPDQRDVTPLYLILSEGEVELIGWEALCDRADAFLSLDEDQRFPIGRIVEPSHDEARAPSSLRLPIRVMAIISAIGANGRPEFEHLYDAVKAARAAGLEMQFRVLVGEPALRTLIDRAVQEPGNADWLSVSHIDAKGSEVVQAISQWKPQIVHVFCHGDAEDADQQLLELATEVDYLQGATKGSTIVRASQLARMVDLLPNPWLITLNACDTGHAASTINSMAHRMVRAGFPAAVAMLEPVNENDAHTVTRAFYGRMFQLLEEVSRTLQTAEEAPFEWLRPMSAVREALVEDHGADPTSAREWTLPVLYVRGVAPFCFRKPIANVSPHEAEEYKKRAAIVAQWLVGPGASQPVEVRKGAIEAALHDLPRPFWPEVDGTWSPEAVAQAAAPAVPQPAVAEGGR